MPYEADRPSTVITLRVQPRAESMQTFLDWQMKFNATIIAFPGFVSLEFLAPTPSQNSWSIIQRFSSALLAEQWLKSLERQDLMQQLKALAVNNSVHEGIGEDSSQQHSVTEVFITHVAPAQEEAFRLWTAKMHRLEADFPGFRAVYLQPPPERSTDGRWITLLQFDSIENLERWLQSSERAQLLQESAAFVSSLQSNRLISPYSGWFASIAREGAVPSTWKQTMTVLLMLFPIVMLEMKYLSPLLKGYNASFGTFISNAISVSLLAFPCLPMANRCLGWWLLPTGSKRVQKTILGTLLIFLLYAAQVAFFWHLF